MGRVDEAMRRAAERAGGVPEPAMPGAGAAVETLAEQDIAALAREPFPIEMPERRRPHPAPVGPAQAAAPVAAAPAPAPAVPAPLPAPVSAFAPVMAESVRLSPARPEPQRPGSLMERIDAALAEKVVVDTNISAASREQYRRLAATLHHAQRDRGLEVVMITSAVPGEGKTLTAANLALTLSESYRRSVLLVDADLRRPALHSVFRIDNSSGLGEGLVAAEQHRLPVRQVSERLAILPAGHPSADPMAGLTSDRMRRLLEEAREVFDWVIIDTPPVALLPDANLLGSMVDGIAIVVKAGSTSYELVRRAIDAVGRQRILGVVLNRAAGGVHSPGYGAYDHYYGAQPPAARIP